jgi:ABC-2 type transport system permease protein
VSVAARAPVREEGRVRSFLDFYATTMRTAVQANFQYRADTFLYMAGTIIEPVVYLVVWSTVARAQGDVAGITAGGFAAYYIAWTLVRQFNLAFTPYGWEWRIREGQVSANLLRPIHPIHYDIAEFAGWKFVNVVVWIPVAVALVLIFDPALNPGLEDVLTFLPALWGAFLLRSLNLWTLGLVSFWTTRTAPLFELYILLELLLSGRLVPLQVMPGWAETIAAVLPFKWTFGFPIEALVRDLPVAELGGGLAIQTAWILGMWGLMSVVWRRAVRRYSAVGN